MNNQSNQALKEDKTVQDHAYDLLGELLLQKETQLMLIEIENEKNTEAEREMNDFFAQHEPHHLRIIEKNSRNGKDRSHLKRQIARAMRIAAVLIVCLTVAGVTAVAGSSHLRVQIMQLLARTTPSYTELSLSVEKEIEIPSEWQGTYYPWAVPERSVISYMDSNNKISWVCFSDEGSDGKWKVSFTEYDEATDIRIDSENANQVESMINGHEVTILEKEGLITVYWNDGQRLLVLQTQRCSLSETITYASNVVMIK